MFSFRCLVSISFIFIIRKDYKLKGHVVIYSITFQRYDSKLDELGRPTGDGRYGSRSTIEMPAREGGSRCRPRKPIGKQPRGERVSVVNPWSADSLHSHSIWYAYVRTHACIHHRSSRKYMCIITLLVLV